MPTKKRETTRVINFSFELFDLSCVSTSPLPNFGIYWTPKFFGNHNITHFKNFHHHSTPKTGSKNFATTLLQKFFFPLSNFFVTSPASIFFLHPRNTTCHHLREGFFFARNQRKAVVLWDGQLEK